MNYFVLLNEIYIKTGKQVVILIDEYDKPILDALYTDFEEPNRQILRAFYSPLKDCDQYIKFLFITGITKVSHVNIFSGLNQLNDISLGEEYSSICGIAESELEKYFKPEIEALSQKRKISYEATMAKLALMYDGYHFSHDVEGVYNPFCILKCFYFKDFGSYWFETATPTFLIKTLQNHVKNATAPYKYPRVIEFVDELPKTTSGKIMRTAIRKADEAKFREEQAKIQY